LETGEALLVHKSLNVILKFLNVYFDKLFVVRLPPRRPNLVLPDPNLKKAGTVNVLERPDY
jgi:hypothetical protein